MGSPHLIPILTINGGSSSIKLALFEADRSLRRILEGRIERIGLLEAIFTVKGLNRAENFSREVTARDHTAAVVVLMDWIEQRFEPDWLPAPDGPIFLVMRLYWPKETPPSILPPGEGVATTSSSAGEVTSVEYRGLSIFHSSFDLRYYSTITNKSKDSFRKEETV